MVVSIAIELSDAIFCVAFTCACTILRVRSGSAFTNFSDATRPRLVLPIGELYGIHSRLPQPFTSASAAKGSKQQIAATSPRLSASGWSGLSMKPIATLPSTPSCRSFQLSDTRPIEPSCTATFLPARSLTDAIDGWPSTIQPPSQPLASTCRGEPLLATCRAADSPPLPISTSPEATACMRAPAPGTSPARARSRPASASRASGRRRWSWWSCAVAHPHRAQLSGRARCARAPRWRARRTPRRRRGRYGATSMALLRERHGAPKRKAHANHRILHAGCLPHKGLPMIGCSHE